MKDASHGPAIKAERPVSKGYTHAERVFATNYGAGGVVAFHRFSAVLAIRAALAFGDRCPRCDCPKRRGQSAMQRVPAYRLDARTVPSCDTTVVGNRLGPKESWWWVRVAGLLERFR